VVAKQHDILQAHLMGVEFAAEKNIKEAKKNQAGVVTNDCAHSVRSAGRNAFP